MEGRRSKQYFGFISYSHKDKAWADWLFEKLERYKVPKRLVGNAGRFGAVPARLTPIFRDREDLASSSDLSDDIKFVLSRSQSLIVICSPAAASSEWVNREIALFKQSNNGTRIFSFIVDGEPAETHPDHCFPRALLIDPESGAASEPLAADVREGGEAEALQKLIAGLVGVELDELRQRELQRRNRRLAVVSIASTVGMLIAFSLATFALITREEAVSRRQQAESLLAFMVGDLQSSLGPIGRLDLLNKVTDQAMDYFSLVDESSLSDEELNYQIEVLTQIGEIRMSKFRYAEAMSTFREAFNRAEILAKRYPKELQYLFSRAQSEFWIGYAHWRQNQLDTATTWFERYHESSQQLVAAEPANENWQQEVIYAEHNLGVLAIDRGAMPQAIVAFERELALLRISIADPERDEVVADTHSWLGRSYYAVGNITLARENYNTSQEVRLQRLEEDESDKQRELWFAVAESDVARIQMVTGERDAGIQKLAMARQRIGQLVEHDPENAMWQRYFLRLTVDLIEANAGGNSDLENIAALRSQLNDTTQRLRFLLDQEPDDRDLQLYLARAARLDVQLSLAAGEEEIAYRFSRAVNMAKTVHSNQPNDHLTTLELARIEFLDALRQRRDGHLENALVGFDSVSDFLAPYVALDGPHPEMLSLAASVEKMKGNDELQMHHEKRLAALGFSGQPLLSQLDSDD